MMSFDDEKVISGRIRWRQLVAGNTVEVSDSEAVEFGDREYRQWQVIHVAGGAAS
jgi:hypothetical protein